MWVLILYLGFLGAKIEQDRMPLVLSGLTEDQCREIAYSALLVIPDEYVVICVEKTEADHNKPERSGASGGSGGGAGI